MKNKDIDRLRGLVPLNTLSEEAFERLLKSLKVEKLGKDEMIFQEGGTLNHYVYLMAGKVALMAGEKQLTAISAEEEEARLALAHHLPRKVGAKTLTAATVARFDGALLNELMSTHQERDYEVSDYQSDDSGDWMDRLLSSGIFQQMSPANLQGVLMRMETMQYAEGDVIIQQGDSGDYYYVVKQGRCAVILNDEGSPKKVAELTPGQGFGEEALLSGHPRASTVSMLTAGEVMRLGKDDFVRLIARPLSRRLRYDQAAKAVEAGAVWLDGQEAEQHAKVNLQGSINLPFSSLRVRDIDLARDHHYIAYTDDGHDCSTAAFLLAEAGFTVSVLEGGLAGVPPDRLLSPRTESGPRPSATAAAAAAVEDRHTVGKLEAELAAMTVKWEEANIRADELETKVQDLQGDQGTLVKKQTEELKKVKAVLVDARDKLKAANQHRKEAVAAERAATKELDKLRAKDEKLRRSMEDRETKLQHLKEEFDQNRKESRNRQAQTEERAQEEQETRAATFELQLTELKDQLEEAEGDRDEAQSRIEELTEQHNSDKQQLEDELGTLREQLGELRSNLEQAEAGGRDLEQQNQTLERRLGETEKLLDEAEVTAERLAGEHKEQLNALQQQLEQASKSHSESEQSLKNDFEQQLSQLQERLSQTETARDEANASAERLDAEHQEQITALRQQLEQADESHQGQIAELEAERQTAQSELASAQEELGTLSERVTAANRRGNSLEEDNRTREKAFEEQRAGMQKQLDEAREQVERARIEREGSESELTDHFDKELAESRDKLAATEAAQREAQERIEELEKEQREASERHASELAEAEQAREVLTSGIDDLKGELETLRQNQQEAAQAADIASSGREQELQTRLEAAEQGQADTAAEVETLRDELAELQQDNARLTEELEAARADSGATADVQELRTELDLARQQAETDLRELREQLEQARAEAATQTPVEELAAADQGGEETAKRIQALEETLAEREEAIEHAKRELEQAKLDLEEEAYQRKDSEAARKQLEEALYQAQEVKDSGEETPATADRGTMPMAEDKAAAGKMGMIGAVAGAVLTLVIAEGILFATNRGELFTGSAEIEAEWQPQPLPPVAVPATPSASQPTQTASREQPPVKIETVSDRLSSGGTGPSMVRIAGGSFTMGSKRGTLSADEKPTREVHVGDFLIGQHEVSFAEYDRFARATGRAKPKDKGWGRGDRPVINVSWEDARAYAKWLSQQTGHSYRLPSEAEWEYAAAAGTTTMYWWGYELGKNQANCFDCGSGWDGKLTAPVGSFPASDFGLHDTAGNVMEWVQDCYHRSYRGAPSGAAAWEEDGCQRRVARGGAYNTPAKDIRTTKRAAHAPRSRLDTIGFRVVRED